MVIDLKECHYPFIYIILILGYQKEKKGKYIITQPGDFIYGVIISKDKLNSLQVVLSNLIEKIVQDFFV